MALFRTRKEDFVKLYSVKGGGDSNFLEYLLPDIPVIEVGDPANDLNWVHIREFVNNVAGAEGWVHRTDVVVASAQNQRTDIDLDAFVTAALNAELSFNSKAKITPFYVDADYLLALANIESGTKDLADQGPLANRFGPYCLDQADWDAFLASGFADPSYTKFSGMLPLAQVDCAAYQMYSLAKSISDLQAASGVGTVQDPYLPRYGELLRARIIGPELTVKMQQMLKSDQGTMLLPDFLKTGISPGEADAMLKYRCAFMRTGGTESGDPLTLKGFNDKCAEILNDELKTAFDRIKTYRPDAIQSPATTAAPWLGIAQREMASEVSESKQAGRQRIAEYFTSTGTKGTADTPWCAAFVAWCLDQCGGSIRASVDPLRQKAASAAAWRDWGDVEISLRDDPPTGAVVLLAAGKDTNDVSHVGFFKTFGDGKRSVTLLGGNQSNKVCETSFKAADIIAIRWKNDLPAKGAVEIVAGAPIPAGREDIARIVVSEFAAAGYAPMQQIVALANAIAESGLDPKLPGDGGNSFGLFQCNMKNGEGAKHRKTDLQDPTYNTRVIIAAANRYGDFANATTIDAAVNVFVRKVERTKDQDGDVAKRKKIAKQLYAGLLHG